MPVSPSYQAYVLEQLQAVGPVVAKAMFGGVGLYQGSVFFGLVADDSLYFKVDDSNRLAYEQAGARQFQPYGENSYSMQYYEVPADVLEDRVVLGEWAARSMAAARSAVIHRQKRPRSQQ